MITGASRGIGLAMAEYCANKGFNLVLIARSGEKLNEVGERFQRQFGVKVHVLSLDLALSQSPDIIFQYCKDQDIIIDKLINNAGSGLYGHFEKIDLQSQLEMINLNQLAILKLTYLFLPELRKNTISYILNVASTACYQPIPFMSAFAATQSFIHSFSLALREELKNSSVNVSVLCPGPTSTEFFERSGLADLPVNSKEIKMHPGEVARIAIDSMISKVSEIVPGTNNAIGAYFSKIFPNTWILKTVSGLFTPPRLT